LRADQPEREDQERSDQDPEEFLELSVETRRTLDDYGLRPLGEVEDDYGNVVDDVVLRGRN
jgi:hypothetical protein